MRGQVEEVVIMADSPVKDKDVSLPLCSTPNSVLNEPTVGLSTTPENCPESCPVLPNGGGTDCCSTGPNSNSSSTQNLAVTPNGLNGYDLLQNGHLSPSEDSGIGHMSDQGSQASQSPNSNQTFTPSQGAGDYTSATTTPHDLPHLHDSGGSNGGNSNGQTTGCHHVFSSSTTSNQQGISPPTTLQRPSPGAGSGGSSSPLCYSPSQPHSRGESPTGGGVSGHSPHDSPPHGGGQQAPQQQQHVVHVHVNPGETFSVRVGDQIQHIQGPATVRMVSNNGPPLPMPMQVPPGHMVQQIVDENGILTHVILSPQPPGMNGAPVTVGYYGAPSGSPQAPMYPPPYGPNGGGYNPFAGQFSHPGGGPIHPGPPPPPPPPHSGNHIPTPPPPPHNTACSQNHPPPPQHIYTTQGPGTHHNHGGPPMDERTQKQRKRLADKINSRNKRQQADHHSSPRARDQGRGGKCERSSVDFQQEFHQSSGSSVEEADIEEEDRRLIRETLSKLSLPLVSEVEPRSALITLSAPEFSDAETERLIDSRTVFQYELLLSEKKDAKYKCVYTGTCTGITLKDLRPATDYHLRVCCIYDCVKGELTDCVSFKTECCEPEAPQSPKLSQKTKTSLLLKWNQAVDNGCKISSYSLEFDEGLGGLFVEVYKGLQRQYKVTKLAASTRYTFRLAAINSIGKSEFCEPIAFCTSGSVPSQPEPPVLSEQFVKALTLAWTKNRQNDDEFTLQMEDEATGHGFLTVYNGPELYYTIKNLRRNTEYKFRLQASNDEGSSIYSSTVCYKTLPDRPCPPTKPQLKGKIHSHSFRINWDSPRDTGGTEITKFCLEVDAGRGFELRYEGAEREFTCDQLEPGHSYRVRVKCHSIGGGSEWSECLVVTTPAVAPGKCHVPKLLGKPRAMSLHLRWNYPDYDGGARVGEFEVLMTNPDNSTREVYRGQDCDCVVAGLLPGRYYLFQVRASNKAGAGPWSDILELVSGAGTPEPPKVACVQCRSAHSAVVSWEEPLNNGATITEYRLEWQAGPEQDFTQLHTGSVLSYEVKNLTPASSYSFRVQAVNSAGAGPYSPVATGITPPSSPGPVLSVRASATAVSIHLTWKEPVSNGSEILSYNIDLGEKHLISVASNTQEYVIQDLLPETTYRVRVQAVNSIGVGGFSPAVKVSTRSLPPAPPRLECMAAGPNSLKLKWGEGKNADMQQYCLEILKDNGSFYPVYQGTALSHKINRLQELTDYTFHINARNQAGEGEYSQTYSFTTTKAPPPAVKEPSVSELGLDCCEVTWPAIRPMGKDSLVYVLQLQRVFPSGGAEYKEVYRGPSTSHRLTSLQQSSDYLVRVSAVRLCTDGGQDLTGAFSPGAAFTTLRPQPTVAPSSATSPIPALPQRRQLTDQQWAAIILVGFTLFAIIIAFLAQKIITYTSSGGGGGDTGGEDSQSPPIVNDSTLPPHN